MRVTSETAVILFCVLLGAAGQIALKLGASSPALAGLLNNGRLPDFMQRVLLSPTVLAGLFLYGISTLLWLVILARSDLSYAYPFISIGFVVTTLFGWLVLGESLSLFRTAGIACIIVGVILVARS